jgi:hypothetical protein
VKRLYFLQEILKDAREQFSSSMATELESRWRPTYRWLSAPIKRQYRAAVPLRPRTKRRYVFLLLPTSTANA